jgi:hypothetical protein
MEKSSRSQGRQSEKNANQKAEASLRKRGTVWQAHFGFKGQFFQRSLGTSDRSKAKIEAKKLIAMAEAGKIHATASSPAERAAQKSSSLRKSYSDPKVNAKLTRARRKSWAAASPEFRRRHREAIKVATNRPGMHERRSETTKQVWQRPGYKERNSRAVRKGWASPSLRKRQSKKITAACARPEVKANRLAGRLRGAAAFLELHGHKNAQGAASAPAHAKTRQRRTSKPQNLTERYRIGSMVEQKVGGGPFTRRAIVSARFAVAAETHHEYDTVKKYHLAYLRATRAVPDQGPTGDE